MVASPGHLLRLKVDSCTCIPVQPRCPDVERRWRRSLQVKFSLVVGCVAVFSIMVLTASQAYVRVQQIQAQILDQNLSTARLLAVQVEGAELSIEHELGAL